MIGRLPALLVAIGAVLWTRAAAAAPADELPIALDVDPCVAIAPARLRELLALELRVLAESGGPEPPGLTRARVGCAGPAVVLTVSVVARPQQAPAERQLDWTAYPVQGRPRLLALALSEMIVRAWASEAAPAVVPAPQQARPRLAAPPPPIEPRRWQLGVLASLERVGRPARTGAGLDLAIGWRPLPWLLVELDGRAGAASFDTAAGTVSARTLSTSVAGLAGARHGRLWAGAGPGVRAGWAWLTGQPGAASAPIGPDPAPTTATSRTFTALWWGPFGQGLLSVDLGRRVGLLASIEAGYVARPVVGEVGPTATGGTVALERAWVTAAAGAAWRF